MLNLSNKRKLKLFLIDFFMWLAAFYVITIIATREFNVFNLKNPLHVIDACTMGIVIFGCRLVVKAYKPLWRYANYFTYVRLVVADFSSILLYYLIGLAIPFVQVPITLIILLVAINLLCSLCGRFLYQIGYYYQNKFIDERVENSGKPLHQINVAVVGAGNIGVSLVEILQRNPKSHYNPYCFIDADADKAGSIVNGLRVYYDDDQIIEKIKQMPIQEIVIAIADLDPARKNALYNKYKQTNCKVKLYDYPITESQTPKKGQIREFKIEDLLFRDTLKFTTKEAKKYYANKTVLVTGGGGSIGSEICRQIAKLKPKKLVIVDIYENNAYEIEQELIRKYGDGLCMETYIASVRDVNRMDDIFAFVRPDIVIHAAAHKHVPLMERSACEAIKNNVMGTYHTANLAEKYEVEKFLLISSDKAVNPTNVMGASKRVCEMVIQCRTDNAKTKFTAVRFGNVLGSNGSVIPLFKRQIENGGPITITDKRIIRYFMTIPEATQLVLEAGAMAKDGELFVLDMGKPVKIIDLAENMIKLSGLVPYKDIDIKEIGLRPGEKLYEELLMKNEELDTTENNLIFIERDKPYTRQEVEEKLKVLLEAVEQGDNHSVREALRNTVPTYISNSLANSKVKEVTKEEMKGTVVKKIS